MIVSELFLYDREAGLFKQILLKSKVMQGRYFIINSGFDVTSADLTTLLPQTYPCVIMTPFRSNLLAPDYTQESLPIDLYFVAKSKATGDNQIKSVNLTTLTPGHFFWQDWKDMKECAKSFLQALKQVIRNSRVNGQPLHGIVSLDPRTNPTIVRFANTTNNILSGAKLSFNVLLNSGCDSDDYTQDDINQIQIPTLNLHPLHKH